MSKNPKNKINLPASSEISTSPRDIQDIQDIKAFKAAFDGKVFLYQIYNISNKELEQIYGLAYDMLDNEQYIDAEDIFRSLCILKHDEEKFWLGLGISLQKQKKYQHASMVYGMAIICSPNTPLGYLLGAQCAMEENDRETAKFVLKSAQGIFGKDKKYEAINHVIKQKIKTLAKS